MSDPIAATPARFTCGICGTHGDGTERTLVGPGGQEVTSQLPPSGWIVTFDAMKGRMVCITIRCPECVRAKL